MATYLILSPRQTWRLFAQKMVRNTNIDAHLEEYIQLISLRLRLPYHVVQQIVMQLSTKDRWNLFRSCENAPFAVLHHERIPMTYYAKKVVCAALEYMKPLLFGYLAFSNLYNTYTKRALAIGPYRLVEKGVYVPLAVRIALLVLHSGILQYQWWPMLKESTEMFARRLDTPVPLCRYCVYGNCS